MIFPKIKELVLGYEKALFLLLSRFVEERNISAVKALTGVLEISGNLKGDLELLEERTAALPVEIASELEEALVEDRGSAASLDEVELARERSKAVNKLLDQGLNDPYEIAAKVSEQGIPSTTRQVGAIKSQRTRRLIEERAQTRRKKRERGARSPRMTGKVSEKTPPEVRAAIREIIEGGVVDTEQVKTTLAESYGFRGVNGRTIHGVRQSVLGTGPFARRRRAGRR